MEDKPAMLGTGIEKRKQRALSVNKDTGLFHCLHPRESVLRVRETSQLTQIQGLS